MTRSSTITRPSIAALAVALAVVCGGGGALGQRLEVAQPLDGETTVRTVRMRFEARNTTTRPIPDASIEVLAPVALSGTTRLLAVESSHPARRSPDGVGNQQVVITLGPLAPGAAAMVTVTAEIEQALGPLRERLPRGHFLAAEPLVEVDNAEILSVAAGLRRGEPLETARAAHDYVVAHVTHSGYSAREAGAAAALSEGSGDCSEMARLFVALARAAGVPARFVGGWMIDGSPLLSPSGYHNWAEFHDGRSWRIADPQQRVFDARYERYVTTRIAGPQVHETMAGAVRYRSRIDDLEVRMLGR